MLLTPAQHSSSGKSRLGKINCRGYHYLRTPLIGSLSTLVLAYELAGASGSTAAEQTPMPYAKDTDFMRPAMAGSSLRNCLTACLAPLSAPPQDCRSNPKTRSSWSQRQAFAMRAAHATASSCEGSSSTVNPPLSGGAHG